MTKISLRGLTWGHRRATGPLGPLSAAFSARHPQIDLDWVVRPLSDFEHQSLPELASIYDLIIYDHPFSGAIVQSGAFEPLSAHADLPVQLQHAQHYLGSSLLSYRLGGTTWGLPIDAATQHAVLRADLLESAGEAVPASWAQTLALGQRLAAQGLSLGLAVKTPHAGLTVAALMSNLGAPWVTDPDQMFRLDQAAFIEAFDQVRALLAFCPTEALDWNAIDLHEAMATTDAVAFCPCAYGYGTYGEGLDGKPLAFADFAGLRAPYHAGSVLGGTGLAVSRRSRNIAAALDFVAFAASLEGQALMASAHGQPGLAALWHDPAVDRRFNGFFSGTRRSVETAWVRPRFPGYIAFQAAAGEAVALALKADERGAQAWQRIAPLVSQINT